MNLVSKYPRISFLLIGFAFGMIMVGVNDRWANATITQYKSIITDRESSYTELLSRSNTKIESLSRVNETLKQRIKTKKITKSDGTIIEETDTDTNTNTVTEVSIRQSIEIKYERKMQVERTRHQTEINKITNRKLRIGIGYTTDLEYYGHASYNMWGPVSMGGGITSGGTLMLDLGVTL